MSDWIKVSERLPKNGEVVLTKIDDDEGVRNCARLMRDGRLWFFPDGSMYVYYTPADGAGLSEGGAASG